MRNRTVRPTATSDTTRAAHKTRLEIVYGIAAHDPPTWQGRPGPSGTTLLLRAYSDSERPKRDPSPDTPKSARGRSHKGTLSERRPGSDKSWKSVEAVAAWPELFAGKT